MTKPKTEDVIMVRTGSNEYGSSYSPIDAEAESVLGGRKSFTVAIPVRGRSIPQNALWAVFYRIVGKDTGQTAEEVKRACKLNYGVPILLAEDKSFRRVWNAKFANDTPAQQLYMMKYLPVTSLFSKGQGIIYTETLQREFAEQNIVLDVL